MKNVLFLLATCLLISSCGIKPKSVEGKEGYPKQYPQGTVDTSPQTGATVNTIPNVTP